MAALCPPLTASRCFITVCAVAFSLHAFPQVPPCPGDCHQVQLTADLSVLSKPPPIFSMLQGPVDPSQTWRSPILPSAPRMQAPTPPRLSPRGTGSPSSPLDQAPVGASIFLIIYTIFHSTHGVGPPRPWQGCHGVISQSAAYSAITSGMWHTDSPSHMTLPRCPSSMRQSPRGPCTPHLPAQLVS